MLSLEVLNLIKKRRSIRKFNSKEISDKDIEELIEAGIYAPTGSNTQCYRFIIIKNKEDIEFLGKNKIPLVGTAKVILFVVADLSVCSYMYQNRKYIFKQMPTQDCAMAIQNISLLATAKNISSCMIQFNEEWPTSGKVKKYFNLDATKQVEGLVLLGYSNKKIDIKTYKHQGRAVKRKPLDFYILGRRI